MQLAVSGPPRSLAQAKHAQWVLDRQALEAARPAGAAEVQAVRGGVGWSRIGWGEVEQVRWGEAAEMMQGWVGLRGVEWDWVGWGGAGQQRAGPASGLSCQ